MEKIPERTIVFGVNDTVTRIGWVMLAVLCVYGAVNAMEIELVGDHVGYKYMGMGALTLYLIQVLQSTISEIPSPVFKAYRWVRTFVPFVIFLIIYFTIYNFQTLQVSVLVLSIVFGLVVLVQLVCPVEGFHFAYVVVIMILGCVLALYAFEYDPKIQPFWFCFLTLFIFQFIIYCLNYPGEEKDRCFSFY